MLQNIIRLINRLMFFLNAIVLTLMLIWSLLGIWEFVPQDDFYWKVFITLVAILLFNVLTIFCLSFLYRKTLKMIDIFNESEYATLHEEGETIFGSSGICVLLPVTRQAHTEFHAKPLVLV